MNWRAWLPWRRPPAGGGAVTRVPGPDTPLARLRLVVVDVETTGLNPRKDDVIAIGAVVIEDNAIVMAQQFECLLQRDVQANDATLIHQITPDTLRDEGIAPRQALSRLQQLADDSVLVAFHGRFDQTMLARAAKAAGLPVMPQPMIDLAEWLPALDGDKRSARQDLDDLLARHKIDISQRHHHAADALVTAQLTLVALARSESSRVTTLAELQQKIDGWRRLRQLGTP